MRTNARTTLQNNGKINTKAWISNVICRSLVMFKDLRWEVIVHFVIGGIDDHHCFFSYDIFI